MTVLQCTRPLTNDNKTKSQNVEMSPRKLLTQSDLLGAVVVHILMYTVKKNFGR